MKTLIIFIINFLCVSLAFGQFNYVMNPGFEKFNACPQMASLEDASHKLIPNWSYPSNAAPDYFNTCGANSDAGVPRNFAGVAEAHSGNGYVGLIVMGDKRNNKQQWREYVQGELAVPLEEGKYYCVSFWYRLASYSRYAIDQLGVAFMIGRYTTSVESSLGIDPNVTTPTGKILDNVSEWKKFSVIYKADGTESFFIIGNFKSYQNMKPLDRDSTIKNVYGKQYSYYYIDDVAITEVKNCRECDAPVWDLDIAGVDTVGNPQSGYTLKARVTGGTPPYQYQWSNDSTRSQISGVKDGVYILRVSDSYGCIDSATMVLTTTKIEPDITEKLKNIKEGEPLVLNNILFAKGKDELLSQSFAELDKVADFMKTSNVREVTILGHTDNMGDDAYNQDLSFRRAQTVGKYIISKGIDASRVVFKGMGETQPIADNNTDAGRTLNRRVEFVISKK